MYFAVSKMLRDILSFFLFFFPKPGSLLQSYSRNNTSYEEIAAGVACTLI